MNINSVLTSSFQGQQITKGIEGNKAIFEYPCSDSWECSPITISLKKGKYRFELWGAQGGDSRYVNEKRNRENSGGKGAYVAGTISLRSSHYFYLYVGGKGENQTSLDELVYSKGGYNGGGKGGSELRNEEVRESSAGGGGATDIRLLYGTSNEALQSRIIVAAGGGGASSTNGINGKQHDYRGGHGGKIEGITYNSVSFGGKPSEGLFGVGMDGLSIESVPSGLNGGSSGGGGGGYYGGGHFDISKMTDIVYSVCEVGGAGGSSFVSGCENCNAVKRLPIEVNEHSGKPNHYSGLIFSDIKMKSGQEEFSKSSGVGTENGHSGNGAIVITFLSSIEVSSQMKITSLSLLLILFVLCY